NCGVVVAPSAVTSAVVARWRTDRPGTYPAGSQPSGGTRTVTTPNIIIAKYSAPIVTNVCQTPTDAGDAYHPMRDSASGAPIIAPPPKPMIAIPVAMPGRSGNPLMSVETGEM